ncbi:MAG: cytochrome c [Chloroflexi bacterium]|nr:cytochrome c [Chloroflexota bacterium]MDA1219573.1 cytochrome c [Chloroflexota bacterium]
MVHNSLKPLILTLALLLTVTACGGGSPAFTEQVATGGRVVYQQNCASCHGLQGEGQPGWQITQPDGRLLAPPHNDTGHSWHHPDGLLFGIVKNGGASLNIPKFESGMPAFGEELTDEEIRSVIEHIKTLWQAGQRESQAEISQNFPFPE